jgi:CRP-like cAMP-binding protein
MSEIDSLSSTSENDSISSSSSNSTSSSGVLDLGASAWNRHKEKRPLKGRTLMQELSGGGAENEHENHNHKQPQQQHVPIHLLQKQIYSSASVTRERIPDSISDRPCKTELEEAVLQDCLTHHFLFSEMHPIHQLIHAFEKVKFRNNEIIFRQGTPAEYLYILYQGDVKTIADTNDESIVPVFGSKYTLLGELELLTHIPYQSTVKATSNPCIFFRLAVADFDRLRQQQRQQQESPSDSQEQKLRLLRQAMPTELVTYFQDDDPAILNRLVSNMKRQPFQKGQVLLPKKKRLDALVLIAEGTVVATHNTAGGRAYEDLVIGPGHSRISFGWQSVMDVSDSEDDDSAMRGRIVARTDGYALLISKRAFENAFHSHHSNNVSVHELAKMRWKRQQLEQITLFKDSRLSTLQLRELMDLMHHCEYGQDQVIFKVGQKVEAAMYFVREGSVRLESNKGRDVDVVEAGGYFGEKNMLLDQNKAEQKHHEKRSLIKAIAASHSTKIDVLYLEECRRVINTTKLGLGASSTVCSIDPDFEPSCLRRHVMLGRGTYGQVWLASVPGSDGKAKNVVALKVQPKYQLLQTSNPQRIIAERNILASLHSPFISRLYFACQDERRLYMVTELLQGGELKTLLPQEGLSESAAKFYAAGILEGLTHMHRKHIIHRDVKTENVLLNEKGYPVLIDFGFGKFQCNDMLSGNRVHSTHICVIS